MAAEWAVPPHYHGIVTDEELEKLMQLDPTGVVIWARTLEGERIVCNGPCSWGPNEVLEYLDDE